MYFLPFSSGPSRKILLVKGNTKIHETLKNKTFALFSPFVSSKIPEIIRGCPCSFVLKGTCSELRTYRCSKTSYSRFMGFAPKALFQSPVIIIKSMTQSPHIRLQLLRRVSQKSMVSEIEQQATSDSHSPLAHCT
jgi:hypothetical protein